MMRGVNAWLTRPRRRVWSGGSRPSMLGSRTSAASVPGGGGNRFDHVSGSRSTLCMSAYVKIDTIGNSGCR